MVQLGEKVSDRITGFQGIVIGKVQYIGGCDQALVTPPVDKEGKHQEAHWFDVQRLDVDRREGPITLDNSTTPGFDAPAPVR